MTTIEAAREALANGAQVIRPRKGDEESKPYQWDVKPYFGGNKRGWIALDSTTAGALVAVYDALKPEMQAKFNSIPLGKLVSFAWKHVRFR